ncbi:enolase C-terminal domain-like protein [Acidisphaera rubrifaciens]|uniref:Mandelate racemase/muconate lactonizing protein n=1 Tax=Acidisphaera rubrifaciens HS-AP3 TaxID=1231350 RepID=A0A0D6P8D0_9PROT|nr:enolase C-terminal domain-like protein [Acidisphaera rubrifaciens]GAN77468.1 mandelate racemase/muconate lactonizing protein [Acidisphaera rubrifaciens HS-AP3]
MTASACPIGTVSARAYTVPTDAPEADGTFAWSETTLVVVTVAAGGRTGLGYTYGPATACALVKGPLSAAVAGTDAFDVPLCQRRMLDAVRNMGRSGIAALAISALDAALWDLKAKLLDVPLAALLGRVRTAVPIYGSGGFTSYDDDHLRAQLSEWVERDGCRWVKMKVGTKPRDDSRRVRVGKDAIGAATLFVDANGAYSVQEALRLAGVFQDECGVAWFEEPVSSDDLDGLAQVRERAPAGVDVAAGEYSFNTDDVHRMVARRAVHVVQVDASRCLGITGFLAAGAVCDAHHLDLSGHCAPALHLHVACSVPRLRHLEWFHDHVRIEHMLFDGAPVPRDGVIMPDMSRPGAGLEFKQQDAERYAA